MVRPDHEDGGELTPTEPTPDDRSETSEENAPLQATDEQSAVGVEATEAGPDEPSSPQVLRSSPLGGRKKKPRPAAATAGEGEQSDEAEVAQASAVEPDGDELAASAVYRERRRKRAVVRRSAGERAAGDGSRLVIVAVSLTALVVVVGVVLSAVFGYQYHKIEQERQLRAEYSTFAQQMVVSMSTLNPDNADQMYKNAMEKTSGRARQMFQENMKQVAEMVRKGDMVTKTTIVADAVSKSEPDEGSVLVVYAWQGHPKNDTKNTDFATFRARVDMTRINGELKMTYFDWVA
ncbi:hypothetical protein [Gordonia aichiensis]|uniref:hypothetical protein n=1 Tax=Gordonia aichiensis TaxID=36820 RepID=UPI0032631601